VQVNSRCLFWTYSRFFFLTSYLIATAHVQSNLLIRVSIPSLSTPTETLSTLASKKLPKSLRSMSPSIVASAIATFDSMTSLLPIEYLNKSLRNDLVDRAIGLDLWISRDEAEASEEERIEQQTCLRRFVAFAKPVGAAIVRLSLHASSAGRILIKARVEWRVNCIVKISRFYPDSACLTSHCCYLTTLSLLHRVSITLSSTLALCTDHWRASGRLY
jgi:hypothetical protein